MARTSSVSNRAYRFNASSRNQTAAGYFSLNNSGFVGLLAAPPRDIVDTRIRFPSHTTRVSRVDRRTSLRGHTRRPHPAYRDDHARAESVAGTGSRRRAVDSRQKSVEPPLKSSRKQSRSAVQCDGGPKNLRRRELAVSPGELSRRMPHARAAQETRPARDATRHLTTQIRFDQHI